MGEIIMEQPSVIVRNRFYTGLALAACMVAHAAALIGCDASAPQEPLEVEESLTEEAPEETLTSGPGYEPVVEPAECQLDLTRAAGYQPECGYLVVPEDRSQPDGRMARLRVVILHSSSSDPTPYSVIYLTGGGGADTMAMMNFFMDTFGAEILESHDLIFYNQRGSRYGEPELQCPGYNEMRQEVVSPAPDGGMRSREEREDMMIDFLLACRDDLVAEGIDLAMYDTAANAADANDLRIALGYDQVDYYASSFGTTIGLALMRDYPEGIHSIVLDAVYPPQVAFYSELPVNFYNAYQQLFEACAADADCHERFPDLEVTFFQIVDELNANPRTFTWEGHEVTYDGGMFMDTVMIQMYSSDMGGALATIEMGSEGEFQIVENLAPGIMDLSTDFINWGAYYNWDCRDEVPFESYENYAALTADLPPQMAAYYTPSLQFDLCEQWGVEPADALANEPVVSDVPALLFAGGIDPLTPARWAEDAAETLSNGHLYVFPGYGHGVTRQSPCALRMILEFFEDPTAAPDSTCMGAGG
jgi:pimeloyl-ACP methyl ester carboxylesterase